MDDVRFVAGPEKLRFLQNTLQTWYELHSRDFPWRKGDASNYQIIISEIFLQRTQATTVSRFYHSFFTTYPDWESLCRASIDDIETIIKPLGLYKQRSKKIYELAKQLKQRGFVLPDSKDEAHDIGMSGLYISNAFELFILKRRAALLDVNMARVLTRYFNYKNANDLRLDSFMQTLSTEVTNVWNCKFLNWAFLDFAALVCTARAPRCTSCILKTRCSYKNFISNNSIEIVDNKKVKISIISARKRCP